MGASKQANNARPDGNGAQQDVQRNEQRSPVLSSRTAIGLEASGDMSDPNPCRVNVEATDSKEGRRRDGWLVDRSIDHHRNNDVAKTARTGQRSFAPTRARPSDASVTAPEQGRTRTPP